jgi:hypothetical protein
MQIFALFMICGVVVSFLVPETKRQTLEALAGKAPLQQTKDSSAGLVGKSGLSSRFGLARQSSGRRTGRRHAEMFDVSGEGDTSVSDQCESIRRPALNEDGIYEQHRTAAMPLQGVGMLLSALK